MQVQRSKKRVLNNQKSSSGVIIIDDDSDNDVTHVKTNKKFKHVVKANKINNEVPLLNYRSV